MPSRSYGEVRDAVAKAIYDQQVAFARSVLDSISINTDQIPKIIKRIKNDSTIGKVLTLSSFIEETIKQIVAMHMLHLETKESQERLFGNNGALGTFSNKINIAFHLGWISKKTRHEIDSFRKIRNECAHKAHSDDTNESLVHRYSANTREELQEFMDTILSITADQPNYKKRGSFNDLTDSEKVMCYLVFVIFRTIVDLMVLPVAISYRINAGDLMNSFNESPACVKNLRLHIADAILQILAE